MADFGLSGQRVARGGLWRRAGGGRLSCRGTRLTLGFSLVMPLSIYLLSNRRRSTSPLLIAGCGQANICLS